MRELFVYIMVPEITDSTFPLLHCNIYNSFLELPFTFSFNNHIWCFCANHCSKCLTNTSSFSPYHNSIRQHYCYPYIMHKIMEARKILVTFSMEHR